MLILTKRQVTRKWFLSVEGIRRDGYQLTNGQTEAAAADDF